MVVLIVNVCKEKLHYFEFVKPVEEILKNEGVDFFVKSYLSVKKDDFEKASSVIICGTSLKDFEYEENINKFRWIKDFEKPVLGICAGMQIIGKVFGGKLKTETEIGFYFENFKRELLGIYNEQEVYHLHNSFIDFKKLKEFEVYCENKNIVQAVKHKEKEIYGVLFHPEVRQKKLILAFAKN